MIENLIENYSIESKLTDSQIRIILDDESLRIKTINYLLNNQKREFATDFLKILIQKRVEENFELASGENMMFASYLVGLHKNINDASLIWKAKNVDFDSYSGMDIQLVVFKGVKETIEYFKSLNTDESLNAIKYIRECENSGDFDDISEYYSRDNLPWWI